MSVGFYFDQTRCTGCRACQVACKDKNRLEIGVNYRKAATFSVGVFPAVKGYSYSFACNHCEKAACLENCPTGAIFRAPDGTVVQDAAICIGCKTCVMSCPYGQPQYSEAKGASGKCDGCYGLRQAGSQPACVAGCPSRALDFGDLAELKAKYGDNLDNGTIAVLPDRNLTQPNVLIKAKEAAFDKGFGMVAW